MLSDLKKNFGSGINIEIDINCTLIQAFNG